MKRKLPQWLLDATIRNNGTITVVPLTSLLSPSRGGVQINDTSNSIPISNSRATNDEIRTTESTSIAALPVAIKTERIHPIEPSTSTVSNEQPQVVVKQEIKDEPVDIATSTTTTPPTIPALVPKIEDVKPERRSCNYGIKCFRRNADHRTEMAHPGDGDYRRPNLPAAPTGTPACPWGAACYRRNPQHFIQLSHPPASLYVPAAAAGTTTTTTVHVNAVPVPPQSNPTPRRNRNSRAVVDQDDSDAEDDYDVLDPFIDDGSSDEYIPDGGDESDDDEEDTEELIDT